MRLSDAMMLGSMMVSMKPGNWRACALGVAGTAVGIPVHQKRRHEAICDVWPWLASNHDERLCEIVELFDQRVCGGDMTFNELVEYVRSIEPDCDCGTRNCCCNRVTDEEVEALLAVAHDVAHRALQSSHHGQAVEGRA